jgi:hypothetical protein
LLHLEKTRREMFLDWGKADEVIDRLKEVKHTGSEVGIFHPISSLNQKGYEFNQIDNRTQPLSYSKVVDPSSTITYKDYGVNALGQG